MREVIVPADDLVCLGKDKLQELVRCKDCRYFGNKVRIGDTFVCNKHGIYVPENGYCSEGKAK